MLSVTRKLLWPCCGLAMILLPSVVLAQSSKPLPPAAPSPSAASVFSLDAASDDLRLSKPCRLACDAEPLGDLLARLTKETGVSFKTESKWIEDLPTYAYTHSLPLRVLMQRLASLHNLTWRREVTPPAAVTPNAPLSSPVYTLYQSTANKNYIAALKQQKWERLRRHIADLRRVAGLPLGTLKDLADTGDAMARQALDPQTRAGIILAAAVSDAMLDDLIQKHTATFTFAQLAPQCQEALALLAQMYEARQAAFVQAQPLQPGETRSPQPVSAPDKYGVRYFVQGDGAQANLRTMILQPHGYFTGPEPLQKSGMDTWSNGRYAAGQAKIAPANRLESRQIPEAITFEGYALRNALQTVCDKWNLNVFADAYPADPHLDILASPNPRYYPAHTPLSDALDIFGEWDRRLWPEGAAGTDVLMLRKDWYLRRDEGQTDALLARLTAIKAQNLPFTLEDWAELFALPDVAAPRIESALKVSLLHIQDRGEILRFYNDLRPRERQRLLTEGLSYAELSGITQEKLLLAAQAGEVSLNAARLESAHLRVRMEPGVSVFTLQNEAQDGAAPPAVLRVWRIQGMPRGMTANAAPRTTN